MNLIYGYFSIILNIFAAFVYIILNFNCSYFLIIYIELSLLILLYEDDDKGNKIKFSKVNPCSN
jgi:hypothetical protein